MKYYLSLLLALFLVVGTLTAQKTVNMSAVKGNDFGVAYSLPKTSLTVYVYYTKTTKKAGEFYQYAERYLSMPNPITQDEVIYTIDGINAETKGIVDKSKSYLVEFRSGSVASFLTLTEDGVICAINDNYTFTPKLVFEPEQPNTALPDPRKFLSEEILRAGSSAKQAELIAKQIYRLRESRNSILTGEADNMPPDGDAYKVVMSQLDEQEKALTSMFIGTEVQEKGMKEFTLVPDEKDIDRKVIFRFSSKLGVVNPDDLSGAPVYLSLKNKEPKQEQFLTPKEEKEMEKKFSSGIIYNIPAKAILQITYNQKDYVKEEIDVVQYGVQEVISPKKLETKNPVKVIFYPETGAIKQML